MASGEIREVFACGTAAVVTPVGELRWEGGSAPSTAGAGGGEVTNAIRSAPCSTSSTGAPTDTHGWLTRLA